MQGHRWSQRRKRQQFSVRRRTGNIGKGERVLRVGESLICRSALGLGESVLGIVRGLRDHHSGGNGRRRVTLAWPGAELPRRALQVSSFLHPLLTPSLTEVIVPARQHRGQRPPPTREMRLWCHVGRPPRAPPSWAKLWPTLSLSLPFSHSALCPPLCCSERP